MKHYCIDEKQTDIMKGGFEDVGKWVFYLLKEARTANVPWYVLREGIKKVGAYDAYALYPRTARLKDLAEALEQADMVKAHEGKILSVDETSIRLELKGNPMMRMARSCTDDAVFLQDLCDAYLTVFTGIFETYGLHCEIEESSAMDDGHAIIRAVR